MNRYDIALKKRHKVARETMAFYFERSEKQGSAQRAGSYFEKPRNFSFQAGQYVDMTIPDKLDPQDPNNIRSFSLASAPFEKELIIATRIRPDSPFKKVMQQLQLADTVTIQGPLGEFLLPKKTTEPAVFIAGGIGITPFYSMLKQAAHDKRQQQLFLFYSNRTHADAPFLQELSYLAQTGLYTLISVFTQEGDDYIDEALLSRHLNNPMTPRYYIAGPPTFVGAMQRVLMRLGVSMKKVKLDEFTGY